MGEVVDIKSALKPNPANRTSRVSLISLSLAIEYYTLVKEDLIFVKEARSCLMRVSPTNVCSVSPEMHQRVMFDVPVKDALKSLLFA